MNHHRFALDTYEYCWQAKCGVLQRGEKQMKYLGSLVMFLLLLTISLRSCDGGPRYESPVSLDFNAPLSEGVCLPGQQILESFLLKRYREIVGCSTKPEPISDVCKKLRSEIGSTGQKWWGIFEIVRYNHDPIFSDKGDWWPTKRVDRVKLREVCYEGMER